MVCANILYLLKVSIRKVQHHPFRTGKHWMLLQRIQRSRSKRFDRLRTLEAVTFRRALGMG